MYVEVVPMQACGNACGSGIVPFGRKSGQPTLAQHSRNQNPFHPPTLAALAALSQRAGGYAEASFTDCTDCVERTCPPMPQIVAAQHSRNQIRNSKHEIRNKFK